MTPGHFCLPWCTSVCLDTCVHLGHLCLPGTPLSTWDTSVCLGHLCLPGTPLSTWDPSVCLSVLLSTWDTSVHLARRLQCEPCMLNAGAQGDVDSSNPHCQNSLCVVWSPSIICEKVLVKLSLLVGICPIKGPGKRPYGLGFAGLLFV